MYLPRRGALELFADRIELVRELLASCGDRDLTAGLLDQAPCDVLLPFECHEGGRIVEPHEGVQDPLHLLQVGGGELDVPAKKVLERESTEFADDIAQAEKIGRVRHPDILRAREAL